MARHLLIVCAVVTGLLAPAFAQTVPDPQSPPPVPPARLIKPHAHPADTHPVERIHPRPSVDERCRPLKDQLEAALQKPGNAHRLFQARLAHNAGARLCRDGQPDKGLAELQKGLSYLGEGPLP